MFRLKHYQLPVKFLSGFWLSVILCTAVPLVAQAQFEGVQSGSSSTAPTVNPTTDQDAADENKFIPEINIPGQFSGAQDIDNNLFGRYVRAIYIYFIWTVGVIATGMIVYAGVKWVAAAGNQSRIKDARDMINNAIIGVIIALTSVVLLNLLSPGFTTLGIPSITNKVEGKYFVGAAATDVCVRDDQIECGHIKPLGKDVIDPYGKTVPEYCMGTLCKKGTVCSLATQSFTGYKATPNDFASTFTIYQPSGGCDSQLLLMANQLTVYKDIPSLETNEILGCGKINSSKRLVGTDCKETLQDKTGICYIALRPAEVVDRPDNVGDILRKMTCPIE